MAQPNPDPNSMVRLSIDVPHSLMRRLDKHIPWGLKSDVFREMAAHLCDLMDKEGSRKILYLIADKKFNIPESLVEGKEL